MNVATSMKPRIICWFSCGIPSTVAAKLTLNQYKQTHEVEVVYCNTLASEHPDNRRFMAQCQLWLEQPIRVISSDTYETVDEVFEKTRYMSGVKGARCTTEMKKIPRLRFAQPDDIHVFGFTADERRRIENFEKRNPDLQLLWILRDQGITKMDCFKLLPREIRHPKMYQLGFNNNNCPGCVKASSPWYWNMVRQHFPEVFERRCKQSREIGVRLVEIKHHERIFLDELPPGPFKTPRKKENLSCGPECGGPAK